MATVQDSITHVTLSRTRHVVATLAHGIWATENVCNNLILDLDHKVSSPYSLTSRFFFPPPPSAMGALKNPHTAVQFWKSRCHYESRWDFAIFLPGTYAKA
jgi:hypothetical protein